MPGTTTLNRSAVEKAAGLLQQPQPALLSGQDAELAVLTVISSAEGWASAPLGMLSGWVISHFEPMAEVLNRLVGDPGAIIAHGSLLSGVAGEVGSHGGTMTSAREQALTRWEGPASRSFSAMAVSMTTCDQGYADAGEFLGKAHLKLGAVAAVTKHMLVEMVSTMVPTVIKRALLALSVGAPLGVGAGAASMASNVLDVGRNIPVVGGLFGGASDAAAAVAAQLRRAIAKFCSWAASYIAGYLTRSAQLMQQLLATSATVLGQITATGVTMHRAASLLNGHGDPGAGPSTRLPNGSYGETVKGTQHQPQDTDLARIQDHFNNGDVRHSDPPYPYKRVTDPDELAKLGLTKDMLRNDDGFAAGVYVDPTSHPPKYVIPFGGTTGGPTEADWRENGIGAFTVSSQSKDAMAIANAVKNSPQHANVVYSGHSLGGRLAAVASMTSGNGAVTYNAAGVSPATIDYIAASQGRTPQEVMADLNGGQVREYRTQDDVLTWAQERSPGLNPGAPDAPGAKIGLGGNESVLGTDGHGMDHVRDEMEKKYHD